jgi:hypothetical protein
MTTTANARTPTTGTPTETVLTIRVAPNGDHLIAQWSTGWIGDCNLRGETVDGLIGMVLHSIWEEGTRPRRRGRPTRRSKKMRRLVHSRVRIVVEIESIPFDSLRTSKPNAHPQLWRPSTTDSVH